ncbi:hypothetical protein F7725_005083 [Dissostichus mawsoni]|uniref:CREG-like beta-barrel domain-containing protein n=1 Tax=Dissostichus mawsoni TaxID=36200 RepID=A0A7J5XM45_DISMA|nr:hypothetical protein F7725_005083 [Dissostichus mawsoni]
MFYLQRLLFLLQTLIVKLSCCLPPASQRLSFRSDPRMSAVSGLRAPVLLVLPPPPPPLPPLPGLLSPDPPHDEVAQVARFVAHQCDWASMATVSSHSPLIGRPFSNTFSVSDGPRGSGTGTPYLYLTRMEVSVQDLQTDYCRLQGFDPQSPLCAHIILSGDTMEVVGLEAEFAQKALFSRHPEMIDWPYRPQLVLRQAQHHTGVGAGLFWRGEESDPRGILQRLAAQETPLTCCCWRM